MTVCHIFSGDLWAGAEVMIFNLLTCLHEQEDLQVIALSLNEGVLTDKLRAAGIRTHVVSEAEHRFPALVGRVARLLADSPITIIHSHRYKENVLAWRVAKRLGGAELVTTIHGLPESPTRRLGHAVRTRSRTAIDHFVVKHCFRCAVAVSEEMKGSLVRRYGFRADQVRVIRNGALLPQTPPVPGSGRENFHIGTVGRMVPVKGLDLFLEVAAAMRRKSAGVRFSILGEGPLRGELMQKVASLNLQDCVEFLAPRPDPFAYYDSLDLYLNTSLHEGLPLSIVEAMACGKPIVSSAVGGIPEIVVHGTHGFLVADRDPHRFADDCLRLMRDDRLRRSMGERCSSDASARLSATAMAAAYRRLYEECRARTTRSES